MNVMKKVSTALRGLGRLSLGAAVFLTAAPVLAADLPDTEKELVGLYFDESVMVEATTRTLTSLLEVAENVSVVTAEQIEAMHANNLLDVLNRVVGVSVNYFGQDYGSSGHVRLDGTKLWHSLLLVDGVRMNDASGGLNHLNVVPIGIIKRIEIIKGPASSAWGSSLGGVINVITKSGGNVSGPTGRVAARYGAAASREMSAELAGRVGALGYFLYGGGMDSDGLLGDRFFDRDSIYGKLTYDFPGKVTVTAVGGSSDPYFRTARFKSLDYDETISNDSFWGSLYVDALLSEELALHVALQRFAMRFFQNRHELGLGINPGGLGAFHSSFDFDESTTSGLARLVWNHDNITTTFGVEGSRSQMDYILDYGVVWGGPGTEVAAPAKDERRGVFVNSTIRLGKLTVTPGLRYDSHSITNEFVSPSLGGTYRLEAETLLRASVSRGFSAPYLKQIAGGNAWEPFNPDLDPEIVWAYQAGLETYRLPYMKVKATVFHQKVTDVWANSLPDQNIGKTRWNGIELEAAGHEYHGLTLSGNASLVIEDSLGVENDALYLANLLADYHHPQQNWGAQLAGHYVHFLKNEEGELPVSDSFVWDASITRKVPLRGSAVDLFFAVHNLFDVGQYWDYEYENPGRWLEGGLVFRF